MKYKILLLLLYFSADCSAKNEGEVITCPSSDFSKFIEVYAKNTSIQPVFIKYPLLESYLDFKYAPQRASMKHADATSLNFPIINSDEKSSGAMFLYDIDINGKTAKAVYAQTGASIEKSFSFELDKCWNLISIENRDLSVQKKYQHHSKDEPLQHIFPSVKNCTPINFYYDSVAGKSFDGILEKKGYKLASADENFASYNVNELFYGLELTKISIPAGIDSVFTFSINASSEILTSAIQKSTGVKLETYSKEMKVKSGVAYIVKDGAKKSSFVCFTFTE